MQTHAKKKNEKQNPTLRPTWGLVSFLMPSGVHESGPFKVDTFGWKPRIRLSRDEGCGPFNLRRGRHEKKKTALAVDTGSDHPVIYVRTM